MSKLGRGRRTPGVRFASKKARAAHGIEVRAAWEGLAKIADSDPELIKKVSETYRDGEFPKLGKE